MFRQEHLVGRKDLCIAFAQRSFGTFRDEYLSPIPIL
jgi:hypothetical protein